MASVRPRSLTRDRPSIAFAEKLVTPGDGIDDRAIIGCCGALDGKLVDAGLIVQTAINALRRSPPVHHALERLINRITVTKMKAKSVSPLQACGRDQRH